MKMHLQKSSWERQNTSMCAKFLARHRTEANPAVNAWYPARCCLDLTAVGTASVLSLAAVQQHFWKQSQEFLKKWLLIFYIMLPASGMSCTDDIYWQRRESGVSKSALPLLFWWCTVMWLLKIISRKTKTKNHKNAPWKIKFLGINKPPTCKVTKIMLFESKGCIMQQVPALTKSHVQHKTA